MKNLSSWFYINFHTEVIVDQIKYCKTCLLFSSRNIGFEREYGKLHYFGSKLLILTKIIKVQNRSGGFYILDTALNWYMSQK